MRTFEPLNRTRFRWIYLNALMLILVGGSAASTVRTDGESFSSLASLLILAATAAVIAYESYKWKNLQIQEAVRNDLERLSMESLCARTTFNLLDALSGGAQSKPFREDLNQRLTAVWASPLFVHGVAMMAARDTLWPYTCAIGLLCLAFTFLFLPRLFPIKEAMIRSAFQEMRQELDTARSNYRGTYRQAR